MALINCNECNTQVSSKAESCPKCGAPIAMAQETIAAGTQIRTVQETSKKFKLQAMISVTLFIIGAVWLYAQVDSAEADPSPLATLFMLVGLVWYIVNRFRIWWHHK